MKKIFASLILVIFSCFVLVSCSKPAAATPDSAAQTTSAGTQITYERLDVNINVVNSLVPESTTSEQEGGDSSQSSGEGSGESGGLEESEPLASDLKSVLKIIRQTVVEVYATTASGTSAGSGVVIANTDEDGKQTSYIVTCHHVISSAESVQIRTIDGVTSSAWFIGSDPDSDLCVMAVEGVLPAAVIYAGDADDIDVGEAVVAIGNPLGTLGGSVTTGIISATNRNIKIDGKSMSLLQTDAAINGGNSGGGLFTQSGYLIGIVNAKYNGSFTSSVEGLGFAIPSSTMLEISKGLMETYTGDTLGYIKGKYNLGCTVRDYYSGFWTSPKAYVSIVALDEAGCMFKAGIKVNDILVSFMYNGNTYTVTTADDFVEYINSISFKIGDEVIFRVTRNETPYTITVTILQYIYGQS